MKQFLNQFSLLERRYNGPIPASTLFHPIRPLKGKLLDDQGKHMRESLVTRRRAMPAQNVASDARLADLSTMLASFRNASVGYSFRG